MSPLIVLSTLAANEILNERATLTDSSEIASFTNSTLQDWQFILRVVLARVRAK